jgi:hypothetical protein
MISLSSTLRTLVAQPTTENTSKSPITALVIRDMFIRFPPCEKEGPGIGKETLLPPSSSLISFSYMCMHFAMFTILTTMTLLVFNLVVQGQNFILYTKQKSCQLSKRRDARDGREK